MELVDTMVAVIADAKRSDREWQAQAVRELVGSCDAGGDGVEHLLDRLQQGGFGDAVRSWQGAGPCRRISPQQFHAALGDAEVQRLAGRAGWADDQLTAALSRHLPEIVQRLTREGGRRSPRLA